MAQSMGPLVLDVSPATNHRLYDKRPSIPRGLVVHHTGGQRSLAYLQGGVLVEGRVASSDALIARDGTIYVLVPFDCYSFHAGASLYSGNVVIRNNEVNQAFIGVELEYKPPQRPTLEQYHSLAGLIHNKAMAYRWAPPYVILGHYAVAMPPGRKYDPWGFDWGQLYYQLQITAQEEWWKGQGN